MGYKIKRNMKKNKNNRTNDKYSKYLKYFQNILKKYLSE